jgi:hypothetical protein
MLPRNRWRGTLMKQGAGMMVMLLAAVAPQASHACQYTQAPEAVGQTSGEYFAKTMSGAATYVDLVLVEDDGTRPMGQPETGIITVRTIARFKGNSADRFSLFGTGLTLKPESDTASGAPLQHFTSETGQVTPFPYIWEWQGALLPSVKGAAPVPPPPGTSCSPPPLAAKTGRFYLVMRGANGRLLDSALAANLRNPVFGFVPVTLEMDDFWLGAVRLATFDNPAPVKPQVLLALRPGSNATQVEARLHKAGMRVRAAFFRDADLIDEVRPADAEIQAPWLTRARAVIEQRRKGNLGGPVFANHSAAEFVRAKLGPMQRYGRGLGYDVAQAFTISVRREQARSGTSRLFALEIDGDPATFASESFYAGSAPLEHKASGLTQIGGADEAAQFDTQQRIERDIWLLNGGGGNRQGTLPR